MIALIPRLLNSAQLLHNKLYWGGLTLAPYFKIMARKKEYLIKMLKNVKRVGGGWFEAGKEYTVDYSTKHIFTGKGKAVEVKKSKPKKKK